MCSFQTPRGFLASCNKCTEWTHYILNHSICWRLYVCQGYYSNMLKEIFILTFLLASISYFNCILSCGKKW